MRLRALVVAASKPPAARKKTRPPRSANEARLRQKRRKSELNAIKQRLAEMETLLQKRVENKESIIALRMQVLTSQAEGLGWPEGNSRSRRGAVYGAVGVTYPSPPSLPSPQPTPEPTTSTGRRTSPR